jgi:DNA mismatch repair ATPase MutS
MDLVEARRNQLFMPISGVLLLGTQLAIAIEGWRRRHGAALVHWLEAVGEVEALGSLATHAFEHPDDAFAEIGPIGSRIEARGFAHPLLPADRAIRNDLVLGGERRLLMVSGSNMSGKSTLLKALGVNLVLGFAGGPVRAAALRTGPLAIGASLVLRDSLLEGRSRFFAEVLRLKAIAEATEGDRPVLFLLDELLSGTNSHDRAVGARGVIEGLLARGAIGIVTTHDLALTRIAEEQGPRAANLHLDDELVDGRLVFDYRLEPGVVTRSNALELMRMVGLDLRTEGGE